MVPEGLVVGLSASADLQAHYAWSTSPHHGAVVRGSGAGDGGDAVKNRFKSTLNFVSIGSDVYWLGRLCVPRSIEPLSYTSYIRRSVSGAST